jgi:hypothetical protein
MSGQSSVGNSQVYEDGDQKNVPQSEIEKQKKASRFHEGKEHSHKANDSSTAISSSHHVCHFQFLILLLNRGPAVHCQQVGTRGESKPYRSHDEMENTDTMNGIDISVSLANN